MRRLGAKLSDAEINLLVKEADVDGDGQVDINEVRHDPCNYQRPLSLVPLYDVLMLMLCCSTRTALCCTIMGTSKIV